MLEGIFFDVWTHVSAPVITLRLRSLTDIQVFETKETFNQPCKYIESDFNDKKCPFTQQRKYALSKRYLNRVMWKKDIIHVSIG